MPRQPLLLQRDGQIEHRDFEMGLGDDGTEGYGDCGGRARHLVVDCELVAFADDCSRAWIVVGSCEIEIGVVVVAAVAVEDFVDDIRELPSVLLLQPKDPVGDDTDWLRHLKTIGRCPCVSCLAFRHRCK